MHDRTLASLLSHHMGNASVGDARLANLVNSIADNQYFIHRSTIRNWRSGTTLKTNNWRQLVTISAALHLTKEQANSLLASGGCPRLEVLRATAKASDEKLLHTWEPNVVDILHAEEAILQPDISVPLTNDVLGTNSSKRLFNERSTWPYSSAYTWAIVLGIAAVSLFVTLHFRGASTNTHPNLLKNSQLENDSIYWARYVHHTAAAEFDVIDQALKIQIEKPGDSHRYIKLFQAGFSITEGMLYTLRFQVRGTEGNNIFADVLQTAAPENSVGFANSVRREIKISEQWEVHKIVFRSEESIPLEEGGAQVVFEMGRTNPGTIFLDDIQFFQINSTASVDGY